MKILVAVVDYPDDKGNKSMYYVHSRNLYYAKNGIETVVLNFGADRDYMIDGIKVITLDTYYREKVDFDLLVCHAPNVRNHHKFIKKERGRFPQIICVFHGHEVLYTDRYYPAPFSFFRSHTYGLKRNIHKVYDRFKISVWKKEFRRYKDRYRFIFVSQWMYDQFRNCFGVRYEEFRDISSVISNSIGEYFEKHKYSPTENEYDFITIRSNLDEPKYGVDIVVDIARANPEYSFLLIGRGKIFEHIEKPENLHWINEKMSHDRLCGYIDRSTAALMPTRLDAQGLMACELAAYGIPLITSDIDINREVLSDCGRAFFIDNDDAAKSFAAITAGTDLTDKKYRFEWKRFYAENTIYKEIDFIKNLIADDEQ